MLFYINGTNYTATNLTGWHFNVSVFLNNNTYAYQWMSWGNGTDNNFNISSARYYTLNETLVDNEYPAFINACDNNGTLNSTGIAFFNVTILSNNGSALLQINGTNFTATNWTSTLFNISITMINNTYQYQWISWGNGTSHNINISIAKYYTLNETFVDRMPPIVTINSPAAASYGLNALPINFNVSLNENGSVIYSLDGGKIMFL